MRYEDIVDKNRGVYSKRGTYLGFIYKYEFEVESIIKKKNARHTFTDISKLSPLECFLQHKERFGQEAKLINYKILAITNDFY
jgi:hypothetical protein